MKQIDFIKKRIKKIKLFKKYKMNERTKKIFIVILSVLVLIGLLFNFKHLFLVAIVDKQPIFRLALDRELEKQGGQQVLDTMINQALVLQEARRLKVNVTQTEIEAKVAEVTSQIEAQGSNLESFLTTQGLSRKDFEKQVKIQLIIDEIIGKKIEISEEELSTYFEENKDYFEAGTKFEDVRAQIEEELKQQEVVTQFQKWIEEVKTKTTIYNFL